MAGQNAKGAPGRHLDIIESCARAALPDSTSSSHFAYLKNVMERENNRHPMSGLDELLPWDRKPQATT